MKRTWLRIIALILVAFVSLAGNYHQDTLDVIGCLKEAIEVSKDAPDRAKLQIQTRKKKFRLLQLAINATNLFLTFPLLPLCGQL